MKYFLNDQSGATSVLVIFMLLVLVTLGAYSISSANVNYTFSRRALEWKEAFYDCDAKAEEFIMDADIALSNAEKKTAETILGYDAGALEGNAPQTINTLFNQNVIKEISLLSDKYGVEINEDDMAVSTVVSSNSGSLIRVKVIALPFRYSLDASDNEVRGVLNGDYKRYAIQEWREMQKTSGDNAVQEPLWDGTIE